MLAEQAYAGLTLVIPDKADEERDAVAAAWAQGGGTWRYSFRAQIAIRTLELFALRNRVAQTVNIVRGGTREATRGGLNAGDLSSAEGTGRSLVQSTQGSMAMTQRRLRR